MRPPEQFQARQLKIIGEQDGPPERTLKAHLIELFEREGGVRRAYLARIGYEGADAHTWRSAYTQAAPSEGWWKRISEIWSKRSVRISRLFLAVKHIRI